MWIYWKDMESRPVRPLIDNTDELVAELKRRVIDLEKKVSAITAHLEKKLGSDTV